MILKQGHKSKVLEQVYKFTDTNCVEQSSYANFLAQPPVQQDKKKTRQYNNISVCNASQIGNSGAERLPWGEANIRADTKIGSEGGEKQA
jgi:hypothetical protein